METRRLGPEESGIAAAAALLRAGQLVAFPTETVYGLGADGGDAAAVARLYAAKGRPRHNPLILHLPDLAAAARIAVLPEGARRLAAAFWPGPLTLVAPLRPGAPVAPAVMAGLPTVALRVPAHPVAAALLRAAGRPVAAPSANPSGKVSPTTAAHVLEGLDGRIAAVLDAGPCAVGLESSIVAVEPDGGAVLLRPGGLSLEALEAALGAPLGLAGEAAAIRAPGQLASHYAPGARLRLGAAAPRPGEGWLGFGPLPAGLEGPALTLSGSGDLAEAAANLFGHLRALDRAMGGAGVIAVAPVPAHGLGRAINDRLARAAAPRD
ncbi:L-threonylcarbamoyladenylate synthase [Paralimibaculum aggregatum]|uniref:Threonylcarbamoyl-AMP synthase n=1 Tax=Paralimibaculum aggregatum TaxID=3036245 RepID=A0ABQ6LEN5_9RHOB|nr:L-threonylcarbamoyladenylate synthase [Limibaculum sp. NKW23]GMG81810.1 L-threonylcarbamoyladenylate synthase [Limibaculum sp. NKW23]